MPTSSGIVPETALWECAVDSPPRALSQIRVCLIAFLASAAGTDLRYGLDPLLGNHLPFLLSTLAVLAASFFGGLTAGILAIVLSAAADTFLFVQPRYNLTVSAWKDQNQLALFLLAGVCLAILASILRKKFKFARPAQAPLDNY